MGLDALPVVLRRLLGEARVVDPAHHVVVDPLHDGEEDGGARAPARAVERAVGGALRVGVVVALLVGIGCQMGRRVRLKD